MKIDYSAENRLPEVYKLMRTIRRFEETVSREFLAGRIPGFMHVSVGQEAVAAGVCLNLKKGDPMSSNHRGHGHALAFGAPLKELMLEIHAKKGGICGGKGGSMHLADVGRGMIGANAIVGAGAPLTCGFALASVLQESGKVAVCFYGDGATNEGMVFESYNLAKIWGLPAVFVIEDNGYAQATDQDYAVAGTQLARAQSFGIEAVEVDGGDFFEVYEAAEKMIESARSNLQPKVMHIKVDRFHGHYEGDSQKYRPPGEVTELRTNRDPLSIFKQRVIAADMMSDRDFNEIDDVVEAEIAEALEQAQSAPFPDDHELMTDVYVQYPN